MKDLIERVSPSVAQIWVRASGDWVKNGSGFAISADGLIATCHHVINGWPRCAISLGQGAHHPASLVAARPDADLAIVKVETEISPLALGLLNQMEVGREVVWSGYPLYSWLLSFHKGMATYLGEMPIASSNIEGLQLDGTVNKGNSGGPIIDPDDGRVVGILSASMGRIDEALKRTMEAAEATRGMITMTAGGKSLDPQQMLVQIVGDMQRHIQLGVGYGISVDYLSALRQEL